MLFMNPSFNFTFYRTTMSLRLCTPPMCWRTRTARWSAPPSTSTSAPSATTPGTRWAAATMQQWSAHLTLSLVTGPHCQTLSLQSRLAQKTNRASGNLESLQVFSYISIQNPHSDCYSRSPKPPSPPPLELQYSRPRPLVSSSQHNSRLGLSSSSPTFFFNNSSSSSSPLMSPNSSGYFSNPSSPTYSCYSSPVRQQQQVQQQSVHHQHQQLQTNENIVYENLIKLLQFSS